MNYKITLLMVSMGVLTFILSCENEPTRDVNHHPEILSLAQLGLGFHLGGRIL